MKKPEPIALHDVLQSVTFLSNRTPDTSPEESADAFATLADYRDGGIFVGHYAGNSAWERHANGDEIVMVIEGETTLYLLEDDEERAARMVKDEPFVVPRNTWHRFETPKGVKIMTVTPQPTEHSRERPLTSQSSQAD